MAASPSQAAIPKVLVGRFFGEVGLRLVRQELAASEEATRAEIARRVCRRLGWRTPGGHLPVMSARVALLRLHRVGLVRLPPPRNGNANGRTVDLSGVDWPAEEPLQRRVDPLPGLALHPVRDEHQSALYNALIERYHYSPVLVESFVEEGRFQATSYRAANWEHVRWTQGRGKKGQWHEPRLPRKSIWVYPLHRRFQQILCTQEPLP